jgi:hypothetical protein
MPSEALSGRLSILQSWQSFDACASSFFLRRRQRRRGCSNIPPHLQHLNHLELHQDTARPSSTFRGQPLLGPGLQRAIHALLGMLRRRHSDPLGLSAAAEELGGLDLLAGSE